MRASTRPTRSCSMCTKTGWYHDLNRDPRTRVPAGFGTAVIQKNQEKFMQKAWQQVQKVYEANRKIRNFQFTMQVSARYHERSFSPRSRRKAARGDDGGARESARQPDDDPPTDSQQPPAGAGAQHARSVVSRGRPASWRSGLSRTAAPFEYSHAGGRRERRTRDAGAAARRSRRHSFGRRSGRRRFGRALFLSWLLWLRAEPAWLLIVVLVLLLLDRRARVARWIVVAVLAVAAVAGFVALSAAALARRDSRSRGARPTRPRHGGAFERCRRGRTSMSRSQVRCRAATGDARRRSRRPTASRRRNFSVSDPATAVTARDPRAGATAACGVRHCAMRIAKLAHGHRPARVVPAPPVRAGASSPT